METKIIKAEDFGIEKDKATTIEKAFIPLVEKMQSVNDVYSELLKSEINEDTVNRAKEFFTQLKKLNGENDRTHKTQKAYFLAGGKFADAIKNKNKEQIDIMKENIAPIKDYYIIQEQKRLDQLQSDRVVQISEYVEDAELMDLSSMADDVWEAYFSTKKKAHEDKLEAIRKEAEAKKERQRIEDLKQVRERELAPYFNFIPASHPNFGELSDDEYSDFLQEMKGAKIAEDKKQAEIKAEKERLESELKEKERLAKVESDKRLKEEQERIKKEQEAKSIQQEKEAKIKAENEAKLEAARLEKERVEKEAKEKQAKLEAELKAKKDAELKAKQEQEAKLEAELKKGDADKIKDLIADLEALKTKYSFKSSHNKKKYKGTGELIDKVVNYIKN